MATAQARGAPQPRPETLAGIELREIGPANMSGRIVDLAVVDSDPRVFYAAASTGGVWKTINNGVTWTPVFKDAGTHSVGDIAVHQRDTSIVWVGTGERANRQSSSWGDGVYKSTDGGTTWANMGLRDSHHIGRIRMHPENPDIVYVAAMGHLWGPNEERGLYKSTDGGQTWRRTLHVDENTGVVDVAIDPQQPNILYAATYQRQRRAYGFVGGGPGSALWKSTDGGETWRKVTAGLPSGDWGRIGITIYPKNPEIVYISLEKGYRFNASTAYVKPAEDAGVFRSDDRGESWRLMGSWNPRPMYASQPLVDPNDDSRIYMENAFSVSADSGKTFKALEQSLHGDDRILWVDPRDSRHLIKGDDGGVGISYDQAKTWLYITNLPVSQWYRVAVDNRRPFRIYGGLQDNGSWVGPSATYRAEGILNEDWKRTGGGDGFVSQPDTVDTLTFYAESQYLGLTRLRESTWERQDIRPGDPTGHIPERRNFDWFYAREPMGDLSNAMEPANWDGPFLISPHDNNTLYAGTQQLWKSTDKGGSWTSLGDLTTRVDRRDLTIMGQGVRDSIPSLDDGVPYYPTLSAVEESPLQRGLLFAGTSDGNLQRSVDDGANWTLLNPRLPGLPDTAWIAGIEASRHTPGTVYVVVNNYRNDDYANYLYKSTDNGDTWSSIAGNLPADRVLRTLREDPRNPRLLWLGSELGLFVSIDGGARWTELRGNLPTLPYNDLVVHPRDNDLVLATHGRGVWIWDNVNAIQEMTPEVLAAPAHLFTTEAAEMIRYAGTKAHTGDMLFTGENPPAGAIIDYHLRAAADSGSVSISIHDASGAEINRIEPSLDSGLNRVIWNLRHANLPPRPGARGRNPTGPTGPWVAPGTYTVRLSAAGQSSEQPLIVREDPRLQIAPAIRTAWTQSLQEIASLYRDAMAEVAALQPLAARMDAQNDTAKIEDAPAQAAAMAPTDSTAQAVAEVADPDPAAGAGGRDAAPLAPAVAAEAEQLNEEVSELLSRIGRVYFDASAWTGPLTADQRSQLEFYRSKLGELRPQVRALVARAGQ